MDGDGAVVLEGEGEAPVVDQTGEVEHVAGWGAIVEQGLEGRVRAGAVGWLVPIRHNLHCSHAQQTMAPTFGFDPVEVACQRGRQISISLQPDTMDILVVW